MSGLPFEDEPYGQDQHAVRVANAYAAYYQGEIAPPTPIEQADWDAYVEDQRQLLAEGWPDDEAAAELRRDEAEDIRTDIV